MIIDLNDFTFVQGDASVIVHTGDLVPMSDGTVWKVGAIRQIADVSPDIDCIQVAIGACGNARWFDQTGICPGLPRTEHVDIPVLAQSIKSA